MPKFRVLKIKNAEVCFENWNHPLQINLKPRFTERKSREDESKKSWRLMCVRSKKYLLGKFFFITFIASSNIFASKIVCVFEHWRRLFKFYPILIFVFSFFWCIQSFKTQLDETWIPFFFYFCLTNWHFIVKVLQNNSRNIRKTLRFPTMPFEFKNFSSPLASVMVGSAGDTKLSAFWNMCFSKSPHFGNRGAAPVGVGERASIYANLSSTQRA